MRFFGIVLALLTPLAAASAEPLAANEPPGPGQPMVAPRAVVELFTSQGCSSCPPADAVLKKLAEDPSIIALSLPVDYWNYLGWKDTFASPRNSERQRNYARARGDGAIYTPQAIINGEVHVNGASEAGIEKAIKTTAATAGPQHIPVRFWQERNTLNFALGGEEPGHAPREATIWLGVVQSSGTVDIKQGENQGKKLTYTNIVRELTPIGIWKGQPMQVQLPRAALMQAEVQKIVVLLQEDRSGPIIGGTLAGLW
ncbi:DUF1223 domain-containing protein [Hyphomicrobium sp.]|jgi:hypothetical protein|uniref:DUF1223 domain-containing protein n=1 Tax=Hyphomicrobium sp. TaxID=82 RepID=UPI002CF843E6|nr:DUF1223 domain-containing protein [Hyphomicrobium sp.]HVZ04903.1 DUF1223 domain-containing protein [Hyphomicrobium sp.]